MKVLLVDDDDDALALLQLLLDHHGIVSVPAGSVAQARAVLVADTGVDVVVTDLELGDGNGLELLPLAPRVNAFIVLTGREGVRPQPGVAVLTKPLDIQLLLAALDAAR